MSPLNIRNAQAFNYGCKKCTPLSQIYFTTELFYLVILINLLSSSCSSIDSLENYVLR